MLRQVLSGAIGAYLLFTMPLNARAAADGSPTPADVIVTANRQAESRLEYSGSLSRIDGDEIKLAGATHAVELLNRAPGLFFQRGSGQESLMAIRSPVLTGAGACGAFLLLEDSMPIRPVGFCNVNELFEIDTSQASAIEIVRGPGAAAFGANAVHGIINVLTPTIDALEGGRASLELGSWNHRRIRFAAGTGDAEAGLQLGAYGEHVRTGDFRRDAGYDDGKLSLVAGHRLAGGELRLRAAGTVLNQETAGFVRGLDAYRDETLRRSNPNPEAFRDAWSARVSANWSGETCEACRTDLRLLWRRSSMEFLQHFLLGKPREQNGQSSVAFSVALSRPLSDALELQAGLDVEAARMQLLEVQDAPTLEGSAAARAIRPAGLHYDYRVRSRAAGAWLTTSWRSAPRWQVGAALRGELTRYEYDNRMLDGNTDAFGVPCPFGGCLFSRPADRRDLFSNLAPKFDVAFEPAAGRRIYLALSHGFRPPETTELYRLQRQQSAAALDSESLDSVELGAQLRAGRWQAALAAFAMRKDDVILREANGFNVSEGRTTHRGVEAEVDWQVTSVLRLSWSGSWARHRYAFSRTIEGGESIVDGNQVDTAPRSLHGVRLAWRPDRDTRVELEWNRIGAYFLDAANLHRYPGHSLLAARASWRAPSANWRLTARVTNLTDRRHADRADFAQGEYRYFPGRPRSFFVELEFGPLSE